MADKAAPRADEPAPIVAQFETQYSTEFAVPGTGRSAADGRQVNVSLSTESIVVKQRVRVVPRQDSAAMVTAEAELPDGVWIPGDAQLYRDGSYIGSTFWNAQAKEKLVLPFGRDDRIQVSDQPHQEPQRLGRPASASATSARSPTSTLSPAGTKFQLSSWCWKPRR